MATSVNGAATGIIRMPIDDLIHRTRYGWNPPATLPQDGSSEAVRGIRGPGGHAPQHEATTTSQIQLIQPKLVCTLGNWATQTLLERKVGITKVKAQAFYLKDFVLFPLLHPAAALHQGNLLPTLKEDFKKLKEFLDRNTKPAEPTSTSPAPAAPTLQIESPQPSQMDLFGS